MYKLPNRPDSGYENKKTSNESEKKSKFKDNLGMYAALLLIVVALFVILEKEQVPYDGMTITDYTSKTDNSGFFVVGELDEGEKFAGSEMNLDEETGIAEIIVYKYGLPSVFGTQEFVVMIDAPKEEVKEIWLSCTDTETQKTERTQLDYAP